MRSLSARVQEYLKQHKFQVPQGGQIRLTLPSISRKLPKTSAPTPAPTPRMLYPYKGEALPHATQ